MTLQLKPSNGLGLILAGGRSLRLFPIDVPKPLLRVRGQSLLEGAIERLGGLEVRVVASAEIRRAITKHVKRKPSFIVEPEPRDTAGAVGFSLRAIEKSAQLKTKKWMAVISADHYFPQRGFHKVLHLVSREMEKYPEALFVLGSPQDTKPRENHSQFGWIVSERGSNAKPSADHGAHGSAAVSRFVEKPNEAVLRELYQEKALINGGMFFGLIDTFRAAYSRHFPEAVDPTFKFEKLTKQPIDRAIFEKFSHVRVVTLNLPWEDLGTWSDWARLGLADRHRLRLQEADHVFSWSDDDSEFLFFGISDVAVIRSGKKIVVMPLSKTPHMKDYVK